MKNYGKTEEEKCKMNEGRRGITSNHKRKWEEEK
jgi:hypothetical protein